LDFFFSSRRRHTRSKRDWSSDVCSSDLFGLTVVAPERSDQMTATLGALSDAGNERPFNPRRHERRRGFEQLLAALTRGIDRRADVALLRGTLEQLVRRIVPVRSVHITDLNGRWSPRTERAGLESISLEIPGV